MHGFLEVGTRYDTWFNRMVGYGFTEGEDFIPVLEKVDAQKRART
ncbi:antA/AntB antirepressor family protein [Neobacillus massiliamazoniensis]